MKLRYLADIRTLFFVATYYGITIVGWIYFFDMPVYLRILTVLLASLFSFFMAVIVHNTIHCPIFTGKWPNKIFQHILSSAYGHAVSAFVPGHNFSHHKYTQTNKDVMRTWKMRFRWNFLNQFLFFHKMSGDILKSEILFVRSMRKEKPRWFRQYVAELVVFFSIQIALIILDWQKYIFLIFIPHQYGVWGLVGTNFWQHDGCDREHKYNHSRNFVSPILNWFAFNNGFHAMHHNKQGLHWSLLPEWHAKYIAPNNHPNLNQKSLFRYLWRTLIFPGKRLTFDNKPVILPDSVKDGDWITELRVNPHKFDLGAEI